MRSQNYLSSYVSISTVKLIDHVDLYLSTELRIDIVLKGKRLITVKMM